MSVHGRARTNDSYEERYYLGKGKIFPIPFAAFQVRSLHTLAKTCRANANCPWTAKQVWNFTNCWDHFYWPHCGYICQHATCWIMTMVKAQHTNDSLAAKKWYQGVWATLTLPEFRLPCQSQSPLKQTHPSHWQRTRALSRESKLCAPCLWDLSSSLPLRFSLPTISLSLKWRNAIWWCTCLLCNENEDCRLTLTRKWKCFLWLFLHYYITLTKSGNS